MANFNKPMRDRITEIAERHGLAEHDLLDAAEFMAAGLAAVTEAAERRLTTALEVGRIQKKAAASSIDDTVDLDDLDLDLEEPIVKRG